MDELDEINGNDIEDEVDEEEVPEEIQELIHKVEE